MKEEYKEWAESLAPNLQEMLSSFCSYYNIAVLKNESYAESVHKTFLTLCTAYAEIIITENSDKEEALKQIKKDRKSINR